MGASSRLRERSTIPTERFDEGKHRKPNEHGSELRFRRERSPRHLRTIFCSSSKPKSLPCSLGFRCLPSSNRSVGIVDLSRSRELAPMPLRTPAREANRRSRLPNSWRPVRSFSAHGKHPMGHIATQLASDRPASKRHLFCNQYFLVWNRKRIFGVWKLEDWCPKLELCRSLSRLSASMSRNIWPGTAALFRMDHSRKWPLFIRCIL